MLFSLKSISFIFIDFKAWRPDKFLLKKHDNLHGKYIKIIGKDPIEKSSKKEEEMVRIQAKLGEKFNIKQINVHSTSVLTPSDHYGLEVGTEFF